MACALGVVRIPLLVLWRSSRGFSATEVTTILTALTILSGMAAPAVSDYVEDAKLIRARSDVRTIAVSLVRLFNDVGTEQARRAAWADHDLLVGAGAAPEAGTREARAWAEGSTRVGLLDDHLVRNGASYDRREPRGLIGWRGSYLQDPVSSDPWGHRYEVNVAAMKGHHEDTVVLSAGPDGLVQSPFEQDGLSQIGDDILAVVSSTGTGR